MKRTPRSVRPGRISPGRPVPTPIARPPYIDPDRGADRRPLAHRLTDPDRLDRMRRAGRVAAAVLDEVGGAVAPGITTDALDAVAHEACVAAGAYPSPLGYRGFPKSICTSVNEVVAHGIPDDRPLEAGDIVNCDVTVYIGGMHGDCSRTILVGDVDDGTRDLVEITEAAMWRGIDAIRPGGHVRDVGRAIEEFADAHGYGVVRELAGHGIGEDFQTHPTVRHYDEPFDSARLLPGMAITVEPMLTLGDPSVLMWHDGWTIVTADGQPSAQFEHTLLVTADGAEVLTTTAGGA